MVGKMMQTEGGKLLRVEKRAIARRSALDGRHPGYATERTSPKKLMLQETFHAISVWYDFMERYILFKIPTWRFSFKWNAIFYLRYQLGRLVFALGNGYEGSTRFHYL